MGGDLEEKIAEGLGRAADGRDVWGCGCGGVCVGVCTGVLVLLQHKSRAEKGRAGLPAGSP